MDCLSHIAWLPSKEKIVPRHANVEVKFPLMRTYGDRGEVRHDHARQDSTRRCVLCSSSAPGMIRTIIYCRLSWVRFDETQAGDRSAGRPPNALSVATRPTGVRRAVSSRPPVHSRYCSGPRGGKSSRAGTGFDARTEEGSAPRSASSPPDALLIVRSGICAGTAKLLQRQFHVVSRRAGWW